MQTSQRHTGAEAGASNAIDIALGTVVQVETINANEHGMGKNVLMRRVRHG